jgi:hypothetical protein
VRRGRAVDLSRGSVRDVGWTLAAGGAVRVVRWRPLLAAAGFSVATVVVLFAWLLLAVVAVAAVGCVLALTAHSDRRAAPAASVTSTALGLAVGPALYLALWLIDSVL